MVGLTIITPPPLSMWSVGKIMLRHSVQTSWGVRVTNLRPAEKVVKSIARKLFMQHGFVYEEEEVRDARRDLQDHHNIRVNEGKEINPSKEEETECDGR